MTLVLNLATGQEEYYMSEVPTEALISAAILHDKRAGSLTDTTTRNKYQSKILFGQRTASIGDLAVKL